LPLKPRAQPSIEDLGDPDLDPLRVAADDEAPVVVVVVGR
jgi:hypothetical protein